MAHDEKPTEPTATPTAESTAHWNPLAAIVIVVSLFLVAQVAGSLLVELLLPSNSPWARNISENARQFWYVAVAEVLTLAGLWGVLKSKGLGRQFIGLVRPKWRDALYAAVGYAVYFMVYVLIVSVVSQLVPSLNINQKQDLGFSQTHGLGIVLIFIPLVILAPLTEEALVRGFLFKNLRFVMGFGWATIIASILFGMAHLSGGEAGAGAIWIAALDTFSLSLVLCFLRERTGRLWACIGLHAIKNAVAFTFLFLVVK
jgi:membrane protease YdiL (CAAX protease family)